MSAYSNRLDDNNDGDRGGGDSDNDGGHDITASAYCLGHPDTVTSSNAGIKTFYFFKAGASRKIASVLHVLPGILPSQHVQFLVLPSRLQTK